MNTLAEPLGEWYRACARDLPWRDPAVGPWGILVSEIMLQQTPAARVVPFWHAWLAVWPRPSDLAAAAPAEVIQAWGTLGYPRRALRLRECASVIACQYRDVVPADETTLRSLPGIGEYTAAAVAAFAYGQRTVVLDTNIRRVIARAYGGEALPPPTLSNEERATAAALLPTGRAESVTWNQASMELGATICASRTWACDSCPVKELCAWRTAGYPGDLHAGRRRTQPWEGTHRQARGRILALLREAEGESVPVAALLPVHRAAARAITTLVADGLAVRDGEALRLPGP
ncbi:MAG: A/G-specific adenine glycosylase [Propionibacteriaceae bacterium]|jgi:A/G-specific adenine glycosylase|nr:A/G-specific adenine glycosylase [Propionibacteriaceae bacterium]